MPSYCSWLFGTGAGEEFRSIEEVRAVGDRWWMAARQGDGAAALIAGDGRAVSGAKGGGAIGGRKHAKMADTGKKPWWS
jgi:hypothetical protein